MAVWQLQDAKAKFSAFLNAALRKGPQVVTRRGVPAAVLVPIAEWERMQQGKVSLKSFLLNETPRFEMELPERGGASQREPVEIA